MQERGLIGRGRSDRGARNRVYSERAFFGAQRQSEAQQEDLERGERQSLLQSEARRVRRSFSKRYLLAVFGVIVGAVASIIADISSFPMGVIWGVALIGFLGVLAVSLYYINATLDIGSSTKNLEKKIEKKLNYNKDEIEKVEIIYGKFHRSWPINAALALNVLDVFFFGAAEIAELGLRYSGKIEPRWIHYLLMLASPVIASLAEVGNYITLDHSQNRNEFLAKHLAKLKKKELLTKIKDLTDKNEQLQSRIAELEARIVPGLSDETSQVLDNDEGVGVFQHGA